MKAPSFFIAEESHDGVLMEYRSKRRGFQFYVQGQIKELSKNFATEIKKLEIEVKKQEVCQKILFYIYHTCVWSGVVFRIKIKTRCLIVQNDSIFFKRLSLTQLSPTLK